MLSYWFLVTQQAKEIFLQTFSFHFEGILMQSWKFHYMLDSI